MTNQIRVNHFKNLYKKNNSAFFLGCGASINELTLQQEKIMKENFDIWSSNSFMIHKRIVPDFYHIEIKHHRNGPLVKRLAHEKKEDFKDVKWIIDQTRPYILNYISLLDYNQENFYVYPKSYRKQSHGNYHPHQDFVSVSCNASMTVIIDMMARLKYENIYFLGVDMNDSRYFWTNDKDYEDVEIEDIIMTCKPDERKASDIHPTAHMKDYIPEFLSFNKINGFNLSSNSLLSEKMKSKKIGEILK